MTIQIPTFQPNTTEEKPTLLIADYQAGNLRSLCNTLHRLGWQTEISCDPEKVATAPLVILPGVGAFPSAVDSLKATGLWEALQARLTARRPLIGICLGMQLLFERSFELRPVQGLGEFPGDIVALTPPDQKMKIPHMGWNTLSRSASSTSDGPLADFRTYSGKDVYFVHSFKAQFPGGCESNVILSTDYGESIPAIVASSDAAVIGFQFHPEKSGFIGAKLLQTALATHTQLMKGALL